MDIYKPYILFLFEKFIVESMLLISIFRSDFESNTLLVSADLVLISSPHKYLNCPSVLDLHNICPSPDPKSKSEVPLLCFLLTTTFK